MSLPDTGSVFSPVEFVAKIDVSGLAKTLTENPDLFGRYDWRKEKYAHTDMRDIWVRYNNPKEIGDTFNDEHSSIWYPVINDIPEVLSICAQLMELTFGERLGGVLITKLPPGGKIKRHIDGGWHAEYYEKFFVPIQNPKGAKFCWNDVVLEPDAGEVYEFDNSVEHWVENDSEEDRIAMIVCIKTSRSSLDGMREEDFT